jgi:hypothetical protein
LDPGSRDLIAAYLIEIRAAIWFAAIRQPDYAKVWNDEDAED